MCILIVNIYKIGKKFLTSIEITISLENPILFEFGNWSAENSLGEYNYREWGLNVWNDMTFWVDQMSNPFWLANHYDCTIHVQYWMGFIKIRQWAEGDFYMRYASHLPWPEKWQVKNQYWVWGSVHYCVWCVYSRCKQNEMYLFHLMHVCWTILYSFAFASPSFDRPFKFKANGTIPIIIVITLCI